jgi:hypothetical protein
MTSVTRPERGDIPLSKTGIDVSASSCELRIYWGLLTRRSLCLAFEAHQPVREAQHGHELS